MYGRELESSQQWVMIRSEYEAAAIIFCFIQAHHFACSDACARVAHEEVVEQHAERGRVESMARSALERETLEPGASKAGKHRLARTEIRIQISTYQDGLVR